MQPKSANQVIAQLRALPAAEVEVVAKGGQVDSEDKPTGPVHAVCLDTTDADAEKRYFSRLTEGDTVAAKPVSSPTIVNASIGQLASMFRDMHIISLVMTPDFGLGQPGDGHGILSGAIPTAETVLNGVEQITPQLMALGLATGKAVLPDHKGDPYLYSIQFVVTDLLCFRCLPSNRPHFGLDMCVAHPFLYRGPLLTSALRLVGTGSGAACLFASLPLGLSNLSYLRDSS
jgi:hypothetical protein